MQIGNDSSGAHAVGQATGDGEEHLSHVPPTNHSSESLEAGTPAASERGTRRTRTTSSHFYEVSR